MLLEVDSCGHTRVHKLRPRVGQPGALDRMVSLLRASADAHGCVERGFMAEACTWDIPHCSYQGKPFVFNNGTAIRTSMPMIGQVICHPMVCPNGVALAFGQSHQNFVQGKGRLGCAHA